MSIRHYWRRILIPTAFLYVVLVPSVASAQEGVRMGPPPEIRALVDAVIKALNSGPDAWDALAQERFAPALLKQRPPAERRKQYEKLRADLGTITFDRATRQGPDAPLELHVKGSTGASGVVSLGIDTGNPPKISEFSVDVKGKDKEPPAGNSFRPPIHGRMTADELNAALDAFLSRLAAADAFSGVVLVAKHGQPVFHKAYGFADRSNGIPNTLQTRFNLGSINKTFTQIAIGQLIAAGKLSPSDTLGKVLPEYPQVESRAATIEQLLSHRGGIADFFGPAFSQAPKDRFRSNADYVRHVSSLAPLFAPGARSQYCNGCYIVLGAVIERVAGMPYERYVAEHIFKIADMTSTGYPHVDAIEPAVATGYTRRGGDGVLRSNVYMHGASGSAAGGGYSTARDLLAFVNARRTGRIGPKQNDFGIAGGAPGISAIVEGDDVWTVIVLANLDPPAGEQIGVAIMSALNAADIRTYEDRRHRR